MNNRSINLVLNIAPLYRKGLFTLLDSTFDCKWFFCENNSDIKGLDTKCLKSVTYIKTTRILKFFRWSNIVPLFVRSNDIFVFTGNLTDLSLWFVLLYRGLLNRKKKVYLWTHGWYGDENIFKRIIKKVFFKMASGVWLYGNYAKQLMLKEGFNNTNLTVIHNSLNQLEFELIMKDIRKSDIYARHFSNSFHNIVFIGRLTAVKKLNMILEAMVLLRRQEIFINLTLVGDGSQRAILEKTVKELNLTDSVWFVGECHDDAKNGEYLYNADICVSPGNVGLTAIHSLSFGTPVITHNKFSEQMPEFEAIIPGSTGDFFEYGDVASLADTIKHWLDAHSIKTEELISNCVQTIKKEWTPQFQVNQISAALGK